MATVAAEAEVKAAEEEEAEEGVEEEQGLRRRRSHARPRLLVGSNRDKKRRNRHRKSRPSCNRPR